MSTTVSSTRIPEQELEQVVRAITAAASISEWENWEIEAANASGSTPMMHVPGDHYAALVSEGAHRRQARTANMRVMTDETQLPTALTTEQFVLAGARSQAASESASRSALHLGSASSASIALGLTSQLSKGTDLFQVFALVALPTVFVFGVFGFARLVEPGSEDFLLGRAINRIRHYYLERAGDTARYCMLSGNDDADGVMANMGSSRDSALSTSQLQKHLSP